MKIKQKQQIVKKWFLQLQKLICNNIEELEKAYGSNKKFKKNKWKYGEFSTIRGEVIEKGGGGLGFEFSGENAEESQYNRIRSLVNEELKQYFRPEFLNRLDEIIVFRQLTKEEVKDKYQLDLVCFSEIKPKFYDFIIIAVGHNEFVNLNIDYYAKNKKSIIFDLKNIYNYESYLTL